MKQGGLQQAGAQASDATADVEFSLLNEKQYTDFLGGRPADALFSADEAHYQELNFSIPPTFAQPAQYYLVFRNSSPGKGKKFLPDDFRIDF